MTKLDSDPRETPVYKSVNMAWRVAILVQKCLSERVVSEWARANDIENVEPALILDIMSTNIRGVLTLLVYAPEKADVAIQDQILDTLKMAFSGELESAADRPISERDIRATIVQILEESPNSQTVDSRAIDDFATYFVRLDSTFAPMFVVRAACVEIRKLALRAMDQHREASIATRAAIADFEVAGVRVRAVPSEEPSDPEGQDSAVDLTRRDLIAAQNDQARRLVSWLDDSQTKIAEDVKELLMEYQTQLLRGQFLLADATFRTIDHGEVRDTIVGLPVSGLDALRQYHTALRGVHQSYAAYRDAFNEGSERQKDLEGRPPLSEVGRSEPGMEVLDDSVRKLLSNIERQLDEDKVAWDSITAAQKLELVLSKLPDAVKYGQSAEELVKMVAKWLGGP